MAVTKECDCCKMTARVIDDLGLCIPCALTQHFAAIIEKKTDLSGDDAMDLGSDLAECACSIILEARDNAEESNDVFADVALGMVRTAPGH